jgi:poly-gamma-glutamate synthesis protein (capsule biosynthesis protein)
MSTPAHTRPLSVLILTAALIAGCGALPLPSLPGQPPAANGAQPAGAQPTVIRTVPVTLYAPTPAPATPTPAPTPTATPVPETTVWVDTRLPPGVREALGQPIAMIAAGEMLAGRKVTARSEPPADLAIGAAGGAAGAAPPAATLILTRAYAVAAPFPTVPDSITLSALTALWQGDASQLPEFSPGGVTPTLFMDADTRAALALLLGDPAAGAPVQLVEAEALVEAAWAARPAALAVLPFERLDPRLKLVWLDGMNLFDRQLDMAQYPLTLRVTAQGAPGALAAFPPGDNRDPNRLAVVAMTGVTALVRGTAVQMERKGITYPGEKIRDWLTSADVAHISNEVSFWDQCPQPTFNDGVSMCSNPKYIELLQYVGTDIVELSGNHLWDKGADKLPPTLDLYDQLGWKYFAGGRNLAEALKPVTMTVNGNRLAFVGCNWFGADWASEERAGSAPCGIDNPRDLDWITGAISGLREEGYLVIATLQYEEYYFYQPGTQQARDFQALRDAGAVVVNGSQGHHAQGWDASAAGTINYGAGNLFFGDQAGVGTHQTFVNRHAFYDGRYLGVDMRTAYIEDYSQPVPMDAQQRADFLDTIFRASGY